MHTGLDTVATNEAEEESDVGGNVAGLDAYGGSSRGGEGEESSGDESSRELHYVRGIGWYARRRKE